MLQFGVASGLFVARFIRIADRVLHDLPDRKQQLLPGTHGTDMLAHMAPWLLSSSTHPCSSSTPVVYVDSSGMPGFPSRLCPDSLGSRMCLDSPPLPFSFWISPDIAQHDSPWDYLTNHLGWLILLRGQCIHTSNTQRIDGRCIFHPITTHLLGGAGFLGL